MNFGPRYEHHHALISPSSVIDGLIERTRQGTLDWVYTGCEGAMSCAVDGGSVRIYTYGQMSPSVRVCDANSLPAIVAFPLFKRLKLCREVRWYLDRTARAANQKTAIESAIRF